MPCGRYGATAGEADARAVPTTTAVPAATTLANAPDAPRPWPTTTYAGEQHSAESDPGEIRIGVAGHFSTGPRALNTQSWNEPS